MMKWRLVAAFALGTLSVSAAFFLSNLLATGIDPNAEFRIPPGLEAWEVLPYGEPFGGGLQEIRLKNISDRVNATLWSFTASPTIWNLTRGAGSEPSVISVEDYLRLHGINMTPKEFAELPQKEAVRRFGTPYPPQDGYLALRIADLQSRTGWLSIASRTATVVKYIDESTAREAFQKAIEQELKERYSPEVGRYFPYLTGKNLTAFRFEGGPRARGEPVDNLFVLGGSFLITHTGDPDENMDFLRELYELYAHVKKRSPKTYVVQ